jgi:hypothetical protein
MNWGYKIALAYTGFVAFMVTLVVLCIQQKDVFLVSENYYAEELKYEDKLVQMRNTSSLDEPVNIALNANADSLNIDLTKSSSNATGKLTFYRPSNPTLDFTLPLDLDNQGTQKIYTKNQVRGLWVIKVQWEKQGKEYYTEQKIQI